MRLSLNAAPQAYPAPPARATGPIPFPPMTTTRIDFLDELRWRGLLHQATHEDALRAHLARPDHAPRRAYCGFDPTADSLTIGNLVPIMVLIHLARAGHTPVVVMGGGTGLIGDPSGKSAERTLMTRDRVAQHVASQREIFARAFAGAGLPEPTIRNNLDWLANLSYLDALRDIGKHFSVNMMVQKDSVRERLHNRDQGISYTEFSYMILQAYDFLHLHEHEGVTVQLGGSDQFGNIVAGCDLIRRVAAAHAQDPEQVQVEAFGMTAPLVTKADGGKFGKTEAGAIWLSANRTSPYAYYQFWLNAADADVGRFLRLFTLLSRDEIESLEAEHAAEPHKRAAQRALARAATALLHGQVERDRAEHAAAALFSGAVRDLDERTLADVFAEVPSSTHDRALLSGAGLPLVQALLDAGIAKSNTEARRLLAEGSISINGEKASADAHLSTADLLHGSAIALRKGKKHWHLTRWQ